MKIGAKVVGHGGDITFQIVEVAVSRALFAQVLGLIADLQAPRATSRDTKGEKKTSRRITFWAGQSFLPRAQSAPLNLTELYGPF